MSHESQVRRYIYRLVDDTPDGATIARSDIRGAVINGLALENRGLTAQSNTSTGVLSDGISRVLRKMERQGRIKRTDRGVLVLHSDATADAAAMLKWLRSQPLPPRLTAIERDAPAMPHRRVIHGLTDVGLAWWVSGAVHVAPVDATDSALIAMAGKSISDAFDSPDRSRP